MSLWLNCNISAHYFIKKEYWENNYDNVKKSICNAEIYIYENENKLIGFVGIVDDYVAGIFVKTKFQSNGIGKNLLDYVKTKHNKLSLSVYKKNERAINFYLKENFSILREKIDNETNETEFFMKWEK